jgi:hypothetical protein
MLALTNVMHFLTHELASLRGRCLALTPRAGGPLLCFLFRHVTPPKKRQYACGLPMAVRARRRHCFSRRFGIHIACVSSACTTGVLRDHTRRDVMAAGCVSASLAKRTLRGVEHDVTELVPVLKIVIRRETAETTDTIAALNTLIQTCRDGEAGFREAAQHRGWMNVKAAVSRQNDGSIIAEAERGEDVAKAAYAEALRSTLPAAVDAIVRRQYTCVLAAHDRVRAMETLHPAGM